jgi:uncharacterized protein (TIGR00369 family)
MAAYHNDSMADPVETVRARAQSNTFWLFLGVQVEDAREGWCRLRVPLRDELRNAPGALFSALVDIAVGGALSTMHEQAEGGVGQSTLDLNVSFISAISEGDVIAEGRILRRGRTIAFGEATITDDGGKLAAVGRATYMIVGGRP